MAMLESDSTGYTPIVESGKCSAAALEKDFWRERMRSAFCDSSGCCWVFDTLYKKSTGRDVSFKQPLSYLGCMLDLEGFLAGSVEIAAIS